MTTKIDRRGFFLGTVAVAAAAGVAEPFLPPLELSKAIAADSVPLSVRVEWSHNCVEWFGFDGNGGWPVARFLRIISFFDEPKTNIGVITYDLLETRQLWHRSDG